MCWEVPGVEARETLVPVLDMLYGGVARWCMGVRRGVRAPGEKGERKEPCRTRFTGETGGMCPVRGVHVGAPIRRLAGERLGVWREGWVAVVVVVVVARAVVEEVAGVAGAIGVAGDDTPTEAGWCAEDG